MQFIDIAYANPIEEGETAEHAVVPAGEHATVPADEGILASLGLNGQMFAFQFINFAIVIAVVWFLILKPVTKKMAERAKMIDASIENAKKVEETLRRGEKDYQERIDTAKVEANKIMEKAGVEAEALSAQMQEKSRKEIEGLVEQAKKKIKIEKDAMSAELKTETAEFLVLALEKILGEKLDEKKDKKLIEDMLAKLQ